MQRKVIGAFLKRDKYDERSFPGFCPRVVGREQNTVRTAQDDGDLSYKVILVPIDFSEHSKKTVKYATRFAVRYHAPVLLLHVFQIPRLRCHAV